VVEVSSPQVSAIQLPNDNSVEAIRKALLDMQMQVNAALQGVPSSLASQVSVKTYTFSTPNPKITMPAADASANVLALAGFLASNASFVLPAIASLYKVSIPTSLLVASSGGPFVLTLTTGKSGTSSVYVPIAANGDTLQSPSLLFNIYVDSAGNVASDSFSVDGSNSNGSWIKYSDGAMECYGKSSILSLTIVGGPFYFNGASVTFPVAFNSAPTLSLATIRVSTINISCGYTSGNPSTTGFGFELACYNSSGEQAALEYRATGRWR
jgi:hypothetical protein